MKIDLNLVSEVEFENVRRSDAPDYSDAWISSALYNGEEASQEILDLLNSADELYDWRYQKLMDFIY